MKPYQDYRNDWIFWCIFYLIVWGVLIPVIIQTVLNEIRWGTIKFDGEHLLSFAIYSWVFASTTYQLVKVWRKYNRAKKIEKNGRGL